MVVRQSRSMLWIALVVGMLLSSCLVNQVSGAYTFTIEPGQQECYFLRTFSDQPSTIIGNFDCIDDDVEARDLSVSISNHANGELVYESPTGSREGTFRLEGDALQPNTRYALCFANNEANDDRENEFDVGFSIHMAKAPRALNDGEIGPDGERALKLVEKATAVQEDWTDLMDHYEYVRNREAIHQEMNDAILNRLSRWTYIEAVLVVGMASGQVMYWKKFFETRRYL